MRRTARRGEASDYYQKEVEKLLPFSLVRRPGLLI